MPQPGSDSFPISRAIASIGKGETCTGNGPSGRPPPRLWDPIRSIILNTGINQDGYTASGITHPNRTARADLIRETYARIGLRPQDVSYIEAHGTGTVAGDHEELAAISDVFITPDRSLPLYVSSNKGSIGHIESTSGLASVLKAALMLDREVIPPVGGFAEPKPGLPLNGIRIPTEQLPWPHVEGITPRVSVNKRHPDVKLSDLSYTLCSRRSALPWRFSCVSHEVASLSNGFRQGLHKLSSRPASSKQEIEFVFTGQGSQWAGMGRELLLEKTPSCIFRDSIRNSRDILCELGAVWNLEAELLRQDGDSDTNKAELAQPVTTAVQLALVALLRAQGVRPSVVMGHSSGEIAAAYAAGRLSQRAALLVAFHRGFMAAASKKAGLPSGAMLAVGLSECEVAPYLDGLSCGKVVVACVNSPGSVTVSGDADAVDEVIERITARGDGTFCRKLRVDTAYHSHHMQAVADEYRTRLDNPTLAEEYRLPSGGAELTENMVFVSSVTGQARSSEFGAAYWVNNLASPVRFYDALQTIASNHSGSRNARAIFLEVGPHSALDGPIRQSLAATDVVTTGYDYFSALQRGTDAVSTMLSLAGRLFERGVKMNLNEVLNLTTRSGTAIVHLDLPSYPWDHSTKHWHESRLNREYRMRREPYHDLLGVRMTESTPLEPRWRHMVGLNTLPWLTDHVIDGLAIFPGAAYVCMAAEAMVQLAREQHQAHLETLIFRDHLELQLSFKRVSDGPALNFAFSATALSDGQWHEPCRGFVEGVMANETKESEPEGHDPLQQPNLSDGTRLIPDSLYTEIAAGGNTYGQAFRGLRSMMMAADGSKSTAVVEIPGIAAIMPAQHQAPHVIHPTTFDSMFHVGIPMIRHHHGAGSVMPVHIGELLVSTKTDALSRPGAELNISAEITSNQFRTTYIDMIVSAHGRPVLSATAIESRSLVAQNTGAGEGICYELTWQPDLDFLHERNLPSNPSLVDVVASICFKGANLSAIELGAGDNDLTLPFLTRSVFTAARKHLIGHPVKYLVLDPTMTFESQGVTPNAYDVVITSNIEALAEPTFLLKTNDILLLALKPEAIENWRKALQEVCPDLHVRTSFFDVTKDRLLVIVRQADAQNCALPSNVQVLTHSMLGTTPFWVNKLKAELGTKGVEIRHESLGETLVQAWTDGDSCIVIVDDLPQPILDDQLCFEAAIELLRERNQILWLSLDDPPSMHQITGVARTAHAEDDTLRLSTVHIAAEVLESDELVEMLARWLNHVADRDGVPHYEREYKVNKDGTLNHAIATPGTLLREEVQTTRYTDALQPIVLGVVFESGSAPDLADDAIEIETRAFVLSKLDDSTASHLGEYAGVVTRDAVLAISIDGAVGHNLAIAMFLPILAVTGGLVLVHGVLSDIGRATVAVARSLGARVTQQLGLGADDTIIGRPSLRHAIFEADQQQPPFGHVVFFHSSYSAATLPRLPRNATVHTSHIADFLHAYPDHTAILIPMGGEAHRLLQLGVHDRVVLQAGAGSLGQWANTDATYVIAGGMGDLGRRLLILMARRGACHLEQLELIRPGCRLLCLACDITSGSGGVIQSAVLLQDRTLENMTYDDFHSVTLAKVQGTIALNEVFTSPSLDFFLTLSSAVNVTGASGQANYNDGNAVQDALAHAGRVGFTSLNVGWIEDTVNTSNNKTMLQGLWRTGLRPILPEQLSRYFDYVLGAASSHSTLRQAVIGFDSESLSHTSAGNSNVRSALFCHVRGSLTTDRTSPPLGGVQSFKDVAESGSCEAAVGFISKSIIGHLATLISVDAANVSERHGSILELGLDSLVAIELRNWITREFEAPLQSSEIMTDQSIQDLAQKVASRSRLILSHANTEVSHNTTQSSVSVTDNSPASSLSLPQIASLSARHVAAKLPPLPPPPLEEILQLFEESRQAIDNAEDRIETTRAVRSFIEGPGPSLRQQLQSTRIEDIAGAYERQVYLERREPLPETGPFTFTHPVDAPIHSQEQRAAILTVAAMDFARRLTNNELPADTLHANPSRRMDANRVERHTPNHTAAVLRRGYVFRLILPAADQPLHLPAVHAAYDEIVAASDKPVTPVCALTADNRDSWALLRQELEHSQENAAALCCIDEAAFVVCLDDESPTSSGEWYTQFLLNGKDQAYEHTKLDGLDARMLHAHISCALLEPADASDSVPSPFRPSAYPIQECVWNPSAAVTQRIGDVIDKCRAYGPLDYQVVEATAHLTVLLAMYYVDGKIRPAWEKVSLGTFTGGRVEWVQTVSPAARAFVEATTTNATSRTRCGALLNEATAAHSRTLAAASRGRAAAGPLYALRGVAQEPLPVLFSTRAWEATCRGGPGQDLKIGFMRFSGDDGTGSENDSGSDLAEAGFLSLISSVQLIDWLWCLRPWP
ncbi:polyketide synthase [Xylaria acuta]|nr:polyketide synthase [Xylaria acuta]